MKALLTSEGTPGTIKDTFFSLLPKLLKENKVAYIITAALDRGDDNPSWLEFNRQGLRNMGIANIEDVDLRKFSKQTLLEKLQDKDIIYVGGGNTYYLMKYVKESGFGELLPSLLERNKLYVGISAGSVIMGPDISLASWIPNDEDVNEGYVSDTKGLGIVPFAIWPHFQSVHKKVIEQKTKEIPYPLVALTNQQAILVNNNMYKLIGTNEKNFYNSPRVLI